MVCSTGKGCNAREGTGQRSVSGIMPYFFQCSTNTYLTVMIRMLLLILAFSGFGPGASAQSNWQPVSSAQLAVLPETPYVQPAEALWFALDLESLKRQLRAASSGTVLLPGPDGVLRHFRYSYDPVMEAPLQARFPEIATYAIRGIDDPAIQGRMDHTPAGFHAMYRTGGRTVLIDPVYRERADFYALYHQDAYWADAAQALPFHCIAEEHDHEPGDPAELLEFVSDLRSSNLDRYEYRIAIATTGEYSQYHGGTVASVLAELATVLNRVNSIFLVDAGIKMNLIANNDKIIFLDPATDGYTNGDAATMINQNPIVLAQFLSFDEYDLGHVLGVFTLGPAIGIAQKPAVCTSGKARGASNGQPPAFDPFIVSILCHELGHQYSCDHTMNKCTNENLSTGWEPGSGTTIMSYAGVCPPNNPNLNIQGNSDAYFHAGSIAQIRQYITQGTGATCGERIATQNLAPVINWPYQDGFSIPISTPFRLAASATDPNGDVLTYCWEQVDTEVLSADPGNPIGNSPIFRSFPPSTNSSRTFPALTRILSGLNSIWEVLPTYSRDMTFRMIVRDGNPEVGATAWRTVAFQATSEAGPFTVSKFNTVDTVYQGEYVEVTWNVANTDKAPVNCQSVNISLSLDGGFNYPFVLAESVPNTGSFFVTIPKATATAGRIRVDAADNIFFDISNANLRVFAATQAGFSLDPRPFRQLRCIPETASWDIAVETYLNFNDPVTLSVVSGLPPGATVSFSQNPVTGPGVVTMTMDLSQVTVAGLYDLVIQGEASGVAVIQRPLQLDLARADYSSLDAVSPASGASNVTQSPVLSWVPQADASRYAVELATSPAFGPTVLISQQGLMSTSWQPSIVLNESQLYFWRVIPSNICGTAQDVPIYAFHTVTLSCAEVSNTSPFNIPAQGTFTVQSPVIVTVAGEVGTLRVKDVKGNHQNFGQLRGNLRSPSGKQIRLWSLQCSNINGNFDFSVNDDSPIAFACPPDKGQTYKSLQPLDTFAGDPLAGTWTFVLEDILSGSGGQLSEWTLEYCANVALNPPYNVRNNTLVIAPGTIGFIHADFLLSEDQDNGPSDLRYTVVRGPRKGTLLNQGNAFGAGATFTQQDINNWHIAYQHGSAEEEEDDFQFTVEDGNGGWYGIATFAIRTDNSVSVTDPGRAPIDMQIWPNPARDQIRLRVPGQDMSDAHIWLYNQVGQAVPVRPLRESEQQILLQTDHLPTGTYFLQVILDGRSRTTRVQITR
jgi:subtilisin-like proprotein convertase family protein